MKRTHAIAISLISVVSAVGLTHALAAPNWTSPVQMAEAARGASGLPLSSGLPLKLEFGAG